MRDTTPDMLEIQRRIHFSLSPEERARRGMEMIETGRRIVENSIRLSQPHLTEAELKAAVFRRCYRNDFSPEELERICIGIRGYWEGRSG